MSPLGSVISVPILSDHPASKSIEHLYIREPLDIMAESKNVDSGLISRLQLIECIQKALYPNPNLSHKTHKINIVYIK